MIAAETSLADGADAVRELRPSLLLVDKAFGVQPVVDFLAALQREQSPPGVIVWGSAISGGETLRFLHAGARGVLPKTASLEAILNCLRAVAAGGTWMDDAVVLDRERSARGAHSPLTAREAQVMELVERGMKNKEIGEALGIRTGTVKIHLKHIFEKTGIRGRYGLALSGLKEKGLLTAVM
jgi:two-component system, NarL family, nitrate/nitrite response regulator NarL